MGDQGDQPPEPGDTGTTQQELSRNDDQRNQPPRLPAPLRESSPKEPKVPAGSTDPQVEVDEVKGLEV